MILIANHSQNFFFNPRNNTIGWPNRNSERIQGELHINDNEDHILLCSIYDLQGGLCKVEQASDSTGIVKLIVSSGLHSCDDVGTNSLCVIDNAGEKRTAETYYALWLFGSSWIYTAGWVWIYFKNSCLRARESSISKSLFEVTFQNVCLVL